MPISSQDVDVVEQLPGELPGDRERAQRVIESPFMLTVTTNFRSKTRVVLQRRIVVFYNTLERLLLQPAFVRACIEITPDAPAGGRLLGVVINTGVEYSNKRAGLHCHSLWQIYHTSKVRINLPVVRQQLAAAFPQWPGMYVNVRFMRGGRDSALNYVYKTVNGMRMRLPTILTEDPRFDRGELVVTSTIRLSDEVVI